MGCGRVRRGGFGRRAVSFMLCSVSATALLIGAAAAQELTGDRADVRLDLTGENGRDADWKFLPWVDNIPSTAGSSGPSREIVNLGTIGAADAQGAAIAISTTGGRGGNADHSVAASDGGAGGNLSFTQSGLVVLGRQGATPLVSLTSEGGRGGNGAISVTGHAGAAGGTVTLISNGLIDTVATGGDVAGTLIALRSSGGRGGSVNGRGGSGGAVTLDLSGSIPTVDLQPTGLPLVLLESAGGNGGVGNWNYGGGAAGTAGSVDFHLSGAAIAASGDQTTGTALVRLLSQGGTGGAGIVGTPEGSRHEGLITSAGGGGAGGAATATVDGDLSTTGARLAALRVTSKGGNGGANGSTVPGQVAAIAGGGSAGLARVDVGGGGSVRTYGDNAPAIIVEALAGNGSVAAPVSFAGAAAGGRGGSMPEDVSKLSVAFTNQGTVATGGQNATAVLLQSVGGSGGRSATWSGGSGGNAGHIVAGNSGIIDTTGSYAFGLVAQSVGGSGGNGADMPFFGGNGGNAGKGGTVTLTNRSGGSIETRGIGATAIVAQSVGGGAGLDAFQSQAILPTAIKGRTGVGTVDPSRAGGDGGSTFGFFFARGGDGGSGGDGNTVKVDNRGSIRTDGEAAYGILAQSIGGSGGNAGDAAALGAYLAVAIGGAGGGGGNGGVVQIGSDDGAKAFLAAKASAAAAAAAALGPRATNSERRATGDAAAADVAGAWGAIETHGDDAAGIIAQSVGGGGGTGGSSIAASAGHGFSVSVAVGGSGGKGGSGGAVGVWNTSVVSTSGSGSAGIQAQSIGGGGGSAGGARSYAIAVGTGPASPPIPVSVSVGGSGGDGGNGGAITLRSYNLVDTRGDSAPALEALSIGGGGGTGGNAFSYALGVQPVTSPAIDVDVAIGGKGGKGGSGGALTVSNADVLATAGVASYGINATSIGGGGGKAGNARSVAGLASYTENVAVTVSVGGKGGGGGGGGEISVENTGLIYTRGQFSNAVDASSIGGGGGQGGMADSAAEAGLGYESYLSDTINALASALPIGKAFTANITIGGSGGSGGSGGKVTLTNQGSILTEGSNASGLVAYSIGGGGGSGGGFQGGGKGNLAGNLRIGGSGGDGGNGGTVTVTNGAAGTIETRAGGSHGIFAQSIGGGGGNGGTFTGERKSAPVTAIATKDEGWLAIGMKLAGELVKVNDSGKQIFGATPYGAAPPRLKSESDADYASRVKNTAQQVVFRDTNFDDGSKLQNGAKRLDQLLTVLAPVQAAYAILGKIETLEAQKGAAPAGADTSAIDRQIADLRTQLAAKGIDAFGTLAMVAFKDNLKAKFKIAETDAAKARAAGAGNYPSASLNVSIGGSGGKGGAGGEATITNGGRIATGGELAYGIFAQSVGGGGGAGGGGFATGDNQVNVNVSVGRNGAGGGDGGVVAVTNTGTVSTAGAASFGLLAQSVGGGGGLGGASSAENGISASANFLIGGDGGASGNGGSVTVKNQGQITTSGEDAHALVAQSVGGGGGIVFNDLKSPRELELKRRKDEADKAAALAAGPTTPEQAAEQRKVAETVGLIKSIVTAIAGDTSAAGDASLDRWATLIPVPALNLNVGGNGRGGGNGGTVTVDHNGSIRTTGDAAFGLFAQSIGGGGGFGANAASAGFSGDITLGGRGGVAGNGGQVDITLGRAATVSTAGTGAHAIFAQSIGGGGGYGGTSKTYLAGNIIRDGSASGNGGDIAIRTATGTLLPRMVIATTGTGANGIFAQSLGGGGGYVGSLLGATVPTDRKPTGRAGAEGRGGKVTIDTVGTISATGANAYGVYVQSGVQAVDGSLARPETRGTGFLNLSKRDIYLGDDISITHTGVLTGGSGMGAAIRIDGGGHNTVTIGEGSVVSAGSGTAILGTWGSEAVSNKGTIVGDVLLSASLPMNDLAGETNTFTNLATGTWRSAAAGSTMRLSMANASGALFTNYGAIDPGGRGVIGTADIYGHLAMQTGGRLQVDVSAIPAAAAQTSDRVFVSGNVSFAAGSSVELNPIVWLLPGSYTFLTTQGHIDGTPAVSGVRQVAVPITWTIGTASSAYAAAGTDMWVRPRADFAHPTGTFLTNDQQQVADQLQRGWDAGSTDMAAKFQTYLGIASGPAYAAALDEGNQESTGYTAATNLANTQLSLKAALSCPAFVGASTLIQEGECVWGRVGGTLTRMGTTRDEGGFRQDGISYRVGAQKEFAPGWFVGGSLGYSQSNMKDPDGLTGFQSDGYDGSLAIKRQLGPWLFALSGSIGNAFQDNVRSLSIGSYGGQAMSKARVFTAGLRARAAYEFTFSNWYVRPYLDLDALHVRTPYMAEYGSPQFNLNVYGARKTIYSASPNVEIGGRFDLTDGYWIRPYGTVGFTLLSDDAFVTRASFQGAPVGLGVFEANSRVPDKLLNLGLGLQVSSGAGFEITAEYQSQLGRDYTAQGGTARISWRF